MNIIKKLIIPKKVVELWTIFQEKEKTYKKDLVKIIDNEYEYILIMEKLEEAKRNDKEDRDEEKRKNKEDRDLEIKKKERRKRIKDRSKKMGQMFGD